MKRLLSLFLVPVVLLAEGEVSTQEIPLFEPSDLTNQALISPDEFDTSSIEMYEGPRKNAFWAATLSGLVPGLGHAYLGDYKTAGLFLGSCGVFGGLGTADLGNDTFQDANLQTMAKLGAYNVYAAYRDARKFNHFEGYHYSMPIESGFELALAPFQWSVIRKPEVWGGLLGALTAATAVTAVSYFFYSDDLYTDCNVHLSTSDETFPLVAFPVGIGEEAFFRGYLQSLFSEFLPPWGAVSLSSLCFGAAHIMNTVTMSHTDRKRYFTYSIPFITSFGVYFGWLTYKNRSLKESVALHSWYDFTLFLISYSAAQSASMGKPSISFSISF